MFCFEKIIHVLNNCKLNNFSFSIGIFISPKNSISLNSKQIPYEYKTSNSFDRWGNLKQLFSKYNQETIRVFKYLTQWVLFSLIRVIQVNIVTIQGPLKNYKLKLSKFLRMISYVWKRLHLALLPFIYLIV